MSKVTYFSIMGKHVYAMVCITPDIAYVIGIVIRFLSKSRKRALEFLKWILSSMRRKARKCLCFGNENLM